MNRSSTVVRTTGRRACIVLVAVVAAILAAGLAVPYIFGHAELIAETQSAHHALPARNARV